MSEQHVAPVVPFPLRARRGLLWGWAWHMQQLSPEKAEAHLRRSLERQREILSRKGIQPDLIEADLKAAEGAARYWATNYTMTRDSTG
jgi:hypothetical protein